ALLLALHALPARPDRGGVADLFAAEHMGMPADELLVDRIGDGLEVPDSLLLQEQREEVDLVEQVAELVEELGVVVGERSVGDLVRLLDRVRDDRLRRLLPVPRAVAAEAASERVEPGQR